MEESKMITKKNKIVNKSDPQKEDAVTAKVYLSGPLIDGQSCKLTFPPDILKAAGIYPQNEVELIATESGIFIKNTGNKLPDLASFVKPSRLNPVVEMLMEDAKFRQRLKRNQLTDEELDQLDADKAAEEAEERKREEEATFYL
jgi:bifunctional DNA-binding transcriptional regulator/antitoxin component of YhaV-PrlF toxin-antitoxin module